MAQAQTHKKENSWRQPQLLPWEDVLVKQSVKLTKKLDSAPIVYSLFSQNLITENDKENIEAINQSTKRNDALITVIRRKDEFVYRNFLQILRSKEVGLKFIADELESMTAFRDDNLLAEEQ